MNLKEYINEANGELNHKIHEMCLQLTNNREYWQTAMTMKEKLADFIKNHPSANFAYIHSKYYSELLDLVKSMQKIVGRMNDKDINTATYYLLQQLLILVDDEYNISPKGWNSNLYSMNELTW